MVSQLNKLVVCLLPFLTPDVEEFAEYSFQIENAADNTLAVWVLAEICKINPLPVCEFWGLSPLLTAMFIELNSEAQLASNICISIGYMVKGGFDSVMEAFDPDLHQPLHEEIIRNFNFLGQALLNAADRFDGGESHLRHSAYIALMELTLMAPKECHSCLETTAIELIRRLNRLYQEIDGQDMDAQGIQQLYVHNELLCLNLSYILPELPLIVALPISGDIFDQLHAMFQQVQNEAHGGPQYSGVQEDALIAMGALIKSIGPHFLRYLPQLMNVLLPCLANLYDQQVCAAAVGVVGDLSRNLAGLLGLDLDIILTTLDGTLQNPGTPPPLLPLIIATIGDLALQSGELFAPYRLQMLNTLENAFNFEADPDNADGVDFLNRLRRSCIDTYACMIQGANSHNPIENANRLAVIFPHMGVIVHRIEHIGQQRNRASDEMIRACCNLIGVIATAFGRDSLLFLYSIDIENLVNMARLNTNVSTKEYADRAYKEMKKHRAYKEMKKHRWD